MTAYNPWEESIAIDYDEFRKQLTNSYHRGPTNQQEKMFYEIMNMQEQSLKRISQIERTLETLTHLMIEDATMRERSPFLQDAWEKYQTAKKLSK